MSVVKYERHGHIAKITLAELPVNAITMPLLDQLLDALHQARADSDIRAVVIDSAIPRFFSAGLDLSMLKDHAADALPALLERLYIDLLDAQFSLGKPTIAAVAGAARGGGMTLAVSCSMIVAGEDATFGYPEIDVAMIPAIHLAHLPKIIGRHRAYELLFTARPFGPKEAKDIGLVTRLAIGSVLEEAMNLAEVLAAKPAGAFTAAHAAFMAENDHRASVRRAVQAFCANAVTDEGREGISAFVEKRQPTWRG